MMESGNQPGTANTQTRRQLISSAAIGLASLAVSPGHAQEPAMKEIPASSTHQTQTTLHYQAEFKASPQRIYEALLDSKQFAAFSGVPAQIDPKAGGEFSLFGALIVGRNVELIPNQRIVQAWRPASWEPGVYSIVRFELKPSATGSTLVLDHTGFPAGLADHLDFGWHSHYLETLQKYFV
jgi:activator of HSP90 ATPase